MSPIELFWTAKKNNTFDNMLLSIREFLTMSPLNFLIGFHDASYCLKHFCIKNVFCICILYLHLYLYMYLCFVFVRVGVSVLATMS